MQTVLTREVLDDDIAMYSIVRIVRCGEWIHLDRLEHGHAYFYNTIKKNLYI